MSEVFPLLLAGHAVGDWIIQTDWQAANKTTSWRANQLHVATYHATLALFLLPLVASVTLRGAIVALLISWLLHSIIDRRWPVKALLRMTGSPKFAETPLGVLAADQTLHLATLALMILLLVQGL